MRTAEEILRSIVTDVEAMAMASSPPERDKVGEEGEDDHWFGSFIDGWYDDEGYYIQWPNLGVLIKEARECLNEKKETA